MQVSIRFGFRLCHWLIHWGEIFKPITTRSNCDRVITFDSHLKTPSLMIGNEKEITKAISEPVQCQFNMAFNMDSLNMTLHRGKVDAVSFDLKSVSYLD